MEQYKNSIKNAQANVNSRLRAVKKVEEIYNLTHEEFNGWQVHALKESIKYAINNSGFYKERIKSIDDYSIETKQLLNKIPLMTRDDIKNNYPFGLLSVKMDDVIRYGESTGTTSRPISAYYTLEDWVENNATVAAFLGEILDSSDIVAVAVPYELAFVGQDLDRALELINSTTIPIGALTRICPPERMIQLFKDVSVTTLICSATRAIYLSDIAKELGYDSKTDFKIKNILCVGEGMSKAKEHLVESLWGANVYSMYGMTETNTLGMFCPHKKTHLVESKSYFEVIDPKTGESLGEDAFGELVVTTLNSKAMPLVRYRTGDLVKIHSAKCKCGVPFRTYEHLGRLDDYIEINENKYQILALEESILGVENARYYTLQAKSKKLYVGLCIPDENFKNAQTHISSRLKKLYDIDTIVSQINNDKVGEIIRNSLKPSIKSVLIDNE